MVRIDARIKDYVVDGYGRHLKRSGALSETTRIREFWTLQRRDATTGCWPRSSRAPRAGTRSTSEIVATPWSDERGMRDEALIEGAVADAVPEGTKVSEVADLQFEGDAHSAANDLSVADGRFAPDVLEIAARRAVDAWAQAVDGDDATLKRIATTAGDAGAAVRRRRQRATRAWSCAVPRSSGSGSSASTPAPSRRR